MSNLSIYSLIFHHSILNIGNCPSKCETCKAGPCERYCSTHNWCGGKSTHGYSGSTDCTGCGGNFLHIIDSKGIIANL